MLRLLALRALHRSRRLLPTAKNQTTGGTVLILTLPFPPSVNRIWRAVAGRILLSRDGRAYREAVARQWLAARLQGHGRRPLVVSIDAWMPDNRRRDLDNLQKASLDALQRAGAFHDDSQICDLRIRRAGIDRQNPRLEVVLEAA